MEISQKSFSLPKEILALLETDNNQDIVIQADAELVIETEYTNHGKACVEGYKVAYASWPTINEILMGMNKRQDWEIKTIGNWLLIAKNPWNREIYCVSGTPPDIADSHEDKQYKSISLFLISRKDAVKSAEEPMGRNYQFLLEEISIWMLMELIYHDENPFLERE